MLLNMFTTIELFNFLKIKNTFEIMEKLLRYFHYCIKKSSFYWKDIQTWQSFWLISIFCRTSYSASGQFVTFVLYIGNYFCDFIVQHTIFQMSRLEKTGTLFVISIPTYIKHGNQFEHSRTNSFFSNKCC